MKWSIGWVMGGRVWDLLLNHQQYTDSVYYEYNEIEWKNPFRIANSIKRFLSIGMNEMLTASQDKLSYGVLCVESINKYLSKWVSQTC